jgi:hypothetical protein
MGCTEAGCQPKYQQPLFASSNDGLSVEPTSVVDFEGYDELVFTFTVADSDPDRVTGLTVTGLPGSDTLGSYTDIWTFSANTDVLKFPHGLHVKGFDASTTAPVITVYRVACSVAQLSAASPNYENKECSGRGKCDRSAGVCSCFDGFYGNACEKQTILV